MAKTKSAGSTKLGRESESKRLGVKLFAGQLAKAGNIIIRQRGTKFFPGENVKRGSDDTLYAIKPGIVNVKTVRRTRFDGRQRLARIISVRGQEHREKERSTE